MTQAWHRPATTAHLYLHHLSNNINAIAIHMPQRSFSFSHPNLGSLPILQVLLWQRAPPPSCKPSQHPAIELFCLSFTSSLSSRSTESLCTFSVLKFYLGYAVPSARSGKDNYRPGEGKNWTGQKQNLF